MFSENLKENTDNRVNISDYGYDEFILVLLFIYCDSLNLNLNLALDLLKVLRILIYYRELTDSQLTH